MGIAALRVLRVRDLTVPDSEALGEHVEIVAVEMHGVGWWEYVVDYKAHGGIGAEVVDQPVGVGVGEIARVGEREDRGATKGLVIEMVGWNKLGQTYL